MSVDTPPVQIVAGDALATALGVGVTATEIIAVSEHPAALVPVTVKVVGTVSAEVMIGVPVCPPGIHWYVAAPAAPSVADCPLHTAVLPETPTVGVGLTITGTNAVSVQPEALLVMKTV